MNAFLDLLQWIRYRSIPADITLFHLQL